MLKRDLKWETEIAFTLLHGYYILNTLANDGTINLGNVRTKTEALADQINTIVDKMFQVRCY